METEQKGTTEETESSEETPEQDVPGSAPEQVVGPLGLRTEEEDARDRTITRLRYAVFLLVGVSLVLLITTLVSVIALMTSDKSGNVVDASGPTSTSNVIDAIGSSQGDFSRFNESMGVTQDVKRLVKRSVAADKKVSVTQRKVNSGLLYDPAAIQRAVERRDRICSALFVSALGSLYDSDSAYNLSESFRVTAKSLARASNACSGSVQQ